MVTLVTVNQTPLSSHVAGEDGSETRCVQLFVRVNTFVILCVCLCVCVCVTSVAIKCYPYQRSGKHMIITLTALYRFVVMS